MGLDMYAFRAKPDTIKNPSAAINLEFKDPEYRATKLAQWRKFNALHGWMEDVWRTRGGQGAFNCQSLRLDPYDLDALEGAINANELKPRAGYFFGPQEIHPEDMEDTRKFIEAARLALAEGDVVFYDSWW